MASLGKMAVVALMVASVTPLPGAAPEPEPVIVNVRLPGAPQMPGAVASRIVRAWMERDPGYRPRTRHLEEDGRPRYTNRLFLESSPYLKQHAHNPVNWFPWGDEAFELARKLGRPVLLSVGYSTCHWCHVMEEESFEDEEIARYLNEHYVAVKVDREERPDVDSIYMSAVQALTGRGGWPMTVWLTPDGQPFYGGTYFPARDGDRGVKAGFLTMLRQLRQVYQDQPDQVVRQAKGIVEAIERSLEVKGGTLPTVETLARARDSLGRRYDAVNGGTLGAPKFPATFPVRFMLREYRRTGDEQALQMAATTLERMAAGGLYDQVGGGFHRYATDARWRVPHFEKMLYDNARLAIAYLEGYQATGREEFARIVREVLRYVAREMTAPEGGFYSATDADSLDPRGRREEGRFFTWTPAEIQAVLGKDEARIVSAYYGVTVEGNLEGRSVPHVARTPAEVASSLGLDEKSVRAVVEGAREKLYRARLARPAPLRDEKILAAWNGLMISAYARAGLAMREPDWVARAGRAADFVLKNMRRRGRLLRSFTDGRPRHNGYLDDYAFVISGLIDLFEASGSTRWLDEAIALDSILQRHYEDAEGGGFFLTSEDHEKLLAREKPAYDGALPSGNSVQALNLLRLAELTTQAGYARRALRTIEAQAGLLAREPAALTEMLLAVDFHLDEAREVILVAPSAREELEPFLERMGSVFLPNRVLAAGVQGEDLDEQRRLVPLIQGKRALRGRVTAYVCVRGVCKLPTSDAAAFALQLEK